MIEVDGFHSSRRIFLVRKHSLAYQIPRIGSITSTSHQKTSRNKPLFELCVPKFQLISN